MLKKYLGKIYIKNKVTSNDIIPKGLNSGDFIVSNTLPEMKDLLEVFDETNSICLELLQFSYKLRNYFKALKSESKKLPVSRNLDIKDEFDKKYALYLSYLNKLNNSSDLLYDEFWQAIIKFTSKKQSMDMNNETK